MKLYIFRFVLLVCLFVSSSRSDDGGGGSNRNALIIGGAAVAGTMVTGYCIARRNAVRWYKKTLNNDMATPTSAPTGWTRLIRRVLSAIKPDAPMEALGEQAKPSLPFILTVLNDSDALKSSQKREINRHISNCLVRDIKADSSLPLHDPRVKTVIRSYPGVVNRVDSSILQNYCNAKEAQSTEAKTKQLLECFPSRGMPKGGDLVIENRFYNDYFTTPDFFKAALTIGHLNAIDQINVGGKKNLLIEVWSECRKNCVQEDFMDLLFCRYPFTKQDWKIFFSKYPLLSEGGLDLLKGLVGRQNRFKGSGLLEGIPQKELESAMRIREENDEEGYCSRLREDWIKYCLDSGKETEGFLDIVGNIPDDGDASLRAYARLMYCLQRGKPLIEEDCDITPDYSAQQRLIEMGPEILNRLKSEANELFRELVNVLFEDYPVKDNHELFIIGWEGLPVEERREKLCCNKKVLGLRDNKKELWDDVQATEDPDGYFEIFSDRSEVDDLQKLEQLVSDLGLQVHEVASGFANSLIKVVKQQSHDEQKTKLEKWKKYFSEHNNLDAIRLLSRRIGVIERVRRR